MRKLSGLLAVAVLVTGFSKIGYAYPEDKPWEQWSVAEKGEYLQDSLANLLATTNNFAASLDTSVYPYVGIGVQVAAFDKSGVLVLVSGILKDSPGEKSDLQLEDLVRLVNGKPVNSAEDFVKLVKEADSDVEIEIERNDAGPVVRKIVCKKALVSRALKEALDQKNESWKKRVSDLIESIQDCQLKIVPAVRNNDGKALEKLLEEKITLLISLEDIHQERRAIFKQFWVY